MLLNKLSAILFIGFYLLSALSHQCYGQNHEYIQYTTKDGLPSNYVYGVVEDDEGYIWAYTENGLSKFDGYTFQNYTTKDGLPGNDVSYAEKDAQGKIWLNIYKYGAAYLAKDSIVKIQEIDSVDYVFRGIFYDFALYESRDKAVVDKYYSLSLEKKDYYSIKRGVPNSLSVFIDSIENSLNKKLTINRRHYWSDKYLYVFNGELIVLCDQDTYQVLSIASIPFTAKNTLLKHLSGTNSFLLGNYEGELILLDFDNAQIKNLHLNQYGLFSVSRTHASIFESTFIITTNTGYLEFDFEGNLLMKFVPDQLLNQYTLLRTFKDSKGNLWVGSRQGGLFFIPRQFLAVSLVSHKRSTKRSFEKIYALDDQQILCITDHAGIFLYENDRLKELIPAGNSFFRTIQSTPLGLFIYTGISGRIIKKESNAWEAISLETFYKDARLLEDSEFFGSMFKVPGGRRHLLYLPTKNYLLEATYNSFVVLQFKSDGQHLVKILPHISDCLFYHKEQDLALSGNKKGLFLYENDDFAPFLREKIGLKNINTIAGSGDDLWLGTEEGGIYHYQFKEEVLTKLYQFPVIRKIKEASDSTLLVVTNEGIKVIPKYSPSTKPIVEYTTLDGLPSNEIRDVHLVGDSILLVATFEGIHKIDRRLKASLSLASENLSIQAFKINNQQFSLDSLPQFSYQQNDLSVSFYLQDYASNGQIKYRFKLSPIEENWRESMERSVNYPSLSPGKYTFHLKAENAFGQEGAIVPITFWIAAPFWKEVWFFVLLGLALTISVVGFVRYRDRLKEAKLAKEKQLNQKLTQLELMAFRAQMNPHFVFNALGSIQYFIQTQDVELADDYLAKFAQLMRMYLDSSKEKMIPLFQELQLLHIYTDLEKMRFEDNFEVQIIKDPGVDEYDYYLPSMILQPLIENAINHGLENRRDGKGLLEVLFKEAQGKLVCYVNDNGIGRKNAAKLRNKGHRSRGMQLIEEKLQTLYNSGIAKIDMEIKDLNPNDTTFPGTQVKLVIENYEDDEY